MLKSLFSGVSGLQAHQIAMDVESNNIANVNTIGFKYSRANFSDLLAQTNQIATAPQGQLGGKNAVQVGLGATVASVTRLHSQGSIQNTDKNTDVAIQGDGFFIVSPDGGNTYKYTRSGDFKFDANGNFVDNNGFIAQGWTRDETTGLVDATAPIQNIIIPPGLTTPANASTEVVLKANLNSGPLVEQFSPTRAIATNGDITLPDGRTILTTDGDYASFLEDMGVMFNGSGQAFSLTSAGSPATGAAGDGGDGIFLSLDGGANYAEFRYTSNPLDVNTGGTGAGTPGVTPPPQISGLPSTTENVFYFNTTEDMRTAMENYVSALGTGASAGSTVTINAQGKYEINNVAGATDLAITVSGITAANDTATTENIFFTESFTPLSGNILAGSVSTKQSQSVNAATHSSSIDIYDSLGSKHTLKMDFRKLSSSPSLGSTWSYEVSVPSPGDIGGLAPNQNILRPAGIATFDNTGAFVGANVPSISFTGNNGSAPNQTVALDFGSPNSFDGLTSFDNPSATSGISQDGFPGGDLLGIRIDQSGTLVGSFSNGRSFGLAQMSMAKFSNNEGLTADGGNVYIQSANSGDPIVGTAATAGRGFIQSSALEASNVDLSRSLTQLIIIQRGYQANGKTITTSDQLLNTLINLKN